MKMKTTAIKQMASEHRHIETVIKSLQDTDAALERGQRLNTGQLRNVVEFLRVYADQRHHQREEALFFPILVKRGVPQQGCPIGGLNNDHQKGRMLVTSFEEKIAFYEQQLPGSDQALRQTLEEIVKLYRHHLWMEDDMVFPMAEKLISEDDNRELIIKFTDLDRTIGPEVIERLEQFAGSLSPQAGDVAGG